MNSPVENKEQSIWLETPVQATAEAVLAGFDRKLFEALAPAFPPLKLLRFDGSAPGDLVDLQLGLWPVRQRWLSRITERIESSDEIGFVDEGLILPAPLQRWRHFHRIRREGPHSRIIDDIRFTVHPLAPAAIVAALLRRSFAARRPIYQRFFGKGLDR